MKTFKNTILAAAIILTLVIEVHSQEVTIDTAALKIGNAYSVTIENGWETEGKLLKIDSSVIMIQSDLKIFTIKIAEITDIRDLSRRLESNSNPNSNPNSNSNYPISLESHRKEKSWKFISGGAGVNFAGQLNESYNPGPNLQINMTKVVSSTYAVRGDVQFSHNTGKTIERNYSYGENQSNSKTIEGDMNRYSFKFDFLFGGFNKNSLINGYFIAGTGLIFTAYGETHESYTRNEYNYSTNKYEWITSSFSYKNRGYTEIPIEVGAGLGVKISSKARIYTEAEYSFPFGGIGGYWLFFGNGIQNGNPSLKLGMQIEL